MRCPHILRGMILTGLLVTSVMGCSNGSNGISQTEAIGIARAAVVAGGVMTLTDRDEVAADEGAIWHVSFPFKAELDVLGGEPHVEVTKTDGTVLKLYYTQ